MKSIFTKILIYYIMKHTKSDIIISGDVLYEKEKNKNKLW